MEKPGAAGGWTGNGKAGAPSPRAGAGRGAAGGPQRCGVRGMPGAGAPGDPGGGKREFAGRGAGSEGSKEARAGKEGDPAPQGGVEAPRGLGGDGWGWGGGGPELAGEGVLGSSGCRKWDCPGVPQRPARGPRQGPGIP